MIGVLALFGAYGFFLGHDWHQAGIDPVRLTASLIGVEAQVAGTTENKIAMQLQAKEAELNRRASALAQAEQNSVDGTLSLLVTSIVGVVLLGLILLNFYLDSVRRLNPAG